MFDEGYIFETEMLKRSIYCFSVDAKGRPIKLGDGKFGVVYEVTDLTAKKFAVKLLYKGQKTHLTDDMIPLTDDIIQRFIEEFGLQSNDPLIKELESLKDLSKIKFIAFIQELIQIDISQEQCHFLFKQIFYSPRSASFKRFEQEIQSSRTIRQRLMRDRDSDSYFDGVVETISGTSKFRQSNAYKTLQSVFESIGIYVSDYALITPLYDCTLKDLLESGVGRYSVRQSPEVARLFKSGLVIPQKLQNLEEKQLIQEINSLQISADEKKVLKEKKYELVGYDVLASMDFNQRISTILPYLRKVVVGIRTLYSVGYSHLDLKPENVFILKRQVLDAVIGDLGFLEPEEAVSSFTHLEDLNDVIPLGTRHFRSPEQKEYFDICNVEIQHGADNGDKKINLIVRDPKFQDTIIEEADYLIFSRDKNRYRYGIDEIRTTQDNLTIITFKLSENAATRLKPDKQTQIILYKRPGIRTDLFGIGAIAFDLITCGESPEKFYDDLRTCDRKDKTVTEIMDIYHSISNFQAVQTDLFYTFSSFKLKHLSTYVPHQFVQFILKCMLYKARGTFYGEQYNENKKSNTYVIDAVLAHLNSLEKLYPPLFVRNPLILGDYSSLSKDANSTVLSEESAVLSDRIKELQSLSVQDLPLRLAKGIWYFRQLVMLVRRSILSKGAFFCELLPINIVASGEKMEFMYSIYQAKQDYLEDLQDDFVHRRIICNIANPYVPVEIAFIRRQIELKKSSRSVKTFQFQFLDSAGYYTSISSGDWLVINAHLYRILQATRQEIEIENPTNSGFDVDELLDANNGKAISCIYYKNLDPCKYYLDMLGIYLHQIFFAGLGNTTIDQSGFIKIAQTLLFMNPRSVNIKGYSINRWRRQRGLEPILQMLTSMYLRLTFPQDRRSFYSQGKSNDDRIIFVEAEAQILQAMIEDFVGERLQSLDALVNDSWFHTSTANGDSKAQYLMKKYGSILSAFPERLEFDWLIKSSLFIVLETAARPETSVMS